MEKPKKGFEAADGDFVALEKFKFVEKLLTEEGARKLMARISELENSAPPAVTREEFNSLKKAVLAAVESPAASETEIKYLRERHLGVAGRVIELESTVDKLTHDLGERLNVLENEIAGVPHRSAGLSHEVEILQTRVAEHGNRDAKQVVRVEGLADRITALEHWRDRPEGPLPALAQRVARLEAAERRMEALAARIDYLVAQVGYAGGGAPLRDVPLTTAAHIAPDGQNDTIQALRALQCLTTVVAAARAVHRTWVSGDPADRSQLVRAMERLGEALGVIP